MTPVLTGSDLLEDRELVLFCFIVVSLVPEILHIIRYLVIICRMGKGWMEGGRADGWINERMDEQWMDHEWREDGWMDG